MCTTLCLSAQYMCGCVYACLCVRACFLFLRMWIMHGSQRAMSLILYVCMCVCVCVCLHVAFSLCVGVFVQCVCVLQCVCAHVCMFCVHVCMFPPRSQCVRVYLHVCMCVCMCLSVCLHVRACVHVSFSTHQPIPWLHRAGESVWKGRRSSRHVIRMSKSWRPHEWVTSQIWMSHGLHINESCPTHVNESWLSYEWVMSHTWMSVNESWLTYEGLIAHVSMSHGTHINESWLTYECAVSLTLICMLWGGYD